MIKKLLLKFKIILVALTFFIVTPNIATSEIAMGITGSLVEFETDGTETQEGDAETNSGSHTEEVGIPGLFVEFVSENGFAIGVSYIPAEELGKKSRTESSTEGQDTGTNTASAEIDDHFMAYVDIPVGMGLYLKGGISTTTIVTTEQLDTGSEYGNEDVFGTTVGLGWKSNGALFYKGEVYIY